MNCQYFPSGSSSFQKQKSEMNINSSIEGSLNNRSNSGSSARVSPNLAVTSSFLKKELGLIIKEELKTFHLRNRLEAQLKDYQEKEINKQLSRMVFEDKMTNYKDKEKASRKKKYDQFQKRQKDREQRLKCFMKNRQQNHQDKFATINSAIENVRERHQHLTHQDSLSRLRKLGMTTGNNSRANQSGNRALSTSYNSSQRDILHQLNNQRENCLVTNYITKITKSESRVLYRDFQNYKRAQTSKKSRVKCLVDQRNRQEVEKMAQNEKQYKQRMDRFGVRRSRVQHQKEVILANRSLANETNFRKAAEKREILKSKENIEQTQTDTPVNYINSKDTILKRYKSSLDLANNRRNMKENLRKMREEVNQSQMDRTMKVLTEKLQKIRNLRYGQKLDERSIKTILSLIDKRDPEFAGLAQFLQLQRRAFLEGLVKKEEERYKFDKKMNKTLSKTGALM